MRFTIKKIEEVRKSLSTVEDILRSAYLKIKSKKYFVHKNTLYTDPNFTKIAGHFQDGMALLKHKKYSVRRSRKASMRESMSVENKPKNILNNSNQKSFRMNSSMKNTSMNNTSMKNNSNRMKNNNVNKRVSISNNSESKNNSTLGESLENVNANESPVPSIESETIMEGEDEKSNGINVSAIDSGESDTSEERTTD